MMQNRDEEIKTIVDLPRMIRVKFPNGKEIKLQDLSFEISISNLKNIIKQRYVESFPEVLDEDNGSFIHKKVRLIYEGRLLSDDSTLSSVHFKNFGLLHCNFYEEQVNIEISENIEVEDDTNNLLENPRGFDRMFEQGFTEEEIEFFRRQFYSTRQHLLTRRQLNQITSEQLREEEERWLNDRVETSINERGQINTEDDPTSINPYYMDDYSSNYRIVNDGTEFDMLMGILVGFFLGFINLLFFCNFFGLSKKFKLGVLFGLCVNSFLSIFFIFQNV